MHFFNIRRKFATNSSSSHSMIVLDEPSMLGDTTPKHDDYGWDNFTLSSPNAKKDYVASLFYQSISRQNGDAVAQAVLDDLGLGQAMRRDIDHQSVINLPLSADQSSANLEFVKELLDFAMRPDVVVLGGNDNEEAHPLSGDGAQVSLRTWLEQDKLVAWKDEKTNLWSLYSRKNGLTLRFSFDAVDEAYVFNQWHKSEVPATRPNLVDVKITDKCPFQCTYCYQGSTPQGVHASLVDIVRVAEALAKEEVFEVALGGGEPTLHPDFDHIIDVFDRRGIKPNFTTRNLSYLKNPNNKSVLEKCGGVAISVDNLRDTEKSIEAINHLRHTHIQASVQLVVGAQSEQEFKDMLKALIEAHVSITFLGYKTTGFGEKFQHNNKQQVEEATKHWLTWLKEVHQEHLNTLQGYKPNLWISIDTSLAQLNEEALKEEKITPNMYHRTEGTQSMYIDAVNNTMAASSFTTANEPFDERWLDRYAAMSAPIRRKMRAK